MKTGNTQKIGYARVSTFGQSLDIQCEKLKKAGCDRIFQEKVSGGPGARAELSKALDYIRSGDTFIVTRLDRLARSLFDLMKTLELLKKKEVDLVVIDQNIDTSSSMGRVVFHILGALAEFERELIKERTREGREKAKLAGVKFGPKESLNDSKKKELVADCEAGQLSKASIGKKFGIDRSSVYRIWKENRKNDL